MRAGPGSRVFRCGGRSRWGSTPTASHPGAARSSPRAKRPWLPRSRGCPGAGRVVDPWGNPVAGARVTANPRRDDVIYRDVDPPETTSTEDGRFALKSLSAGAVTLVADARGFEWSDRSRSISLLATCSATRASPARAARPRPGPPAERRALRGRARRGHALVHDGPRADESARRRDRVRTGGSVRPALQALQGPGSPGIRTRVRGGRPTTGVPVRGERGRTAAGAAGDPACLGPTGRSDVRGVQVEDGAGVRMFAPLDADGRAELTDLSPGEGTAQLAAQLKAAASRSSFAPARRPRSRWGSTARSWRVR